MIIRDRQLQQLEQSLRQPFVDWVVDHLERYFPEECAARGQPAVGEAVELGIERAKGYGIDGGPEIVRYINLMFALHDDFDRNSTMPWAAQILQDNALDGAAKLTSLNAYAEMEIPDEGGGPLPPEAEAEPPRL